MACLKNSLGKVRSIIAYIQTNNLEVIADPGLSKTEILDVFNSINLQPPSEIVELYQWHNGIGELDCFLSFMNLSDAAIWYQDFMRKKTEHPQWKWNNNYFPILNMNGDVQLCLDFKTFSVITIDIECNIVVTWQA